MLQDLQYYSDMAQQVIADNNPRDELYRKIDEATHAVFENPPELKALPWIQERKFVSTAPGDALNAAVRTFAARMPKIQIQPLSDEQEEYDRVETLEELMEWEFSRMNMTGKKSPHWKIVEYAMKYCAVAIETEYLPYTYQGREKTPRVKQILNSKHFIWRVHDPSTVYAHETDDTLEFVLRTAVYSAQELVELFGMENEGVAKAVKDIKDSGASMVSTMFSFYDYTDWDVRVKWCVSNGGSMYLNREAPSGYEIMRQERTIPFLPWVIVDNQEPILKQMIDAGLWETVNILRTMQFSKAVDMAAHPEYWIQTPDGTLRGVSIDGTNPNQPIVTGPGVNINKLVPPQIDPQMAQLTSQAESEVFRTTVAQILASVEKYAGTQNFSVVNAMLNAAVAQLSLAQMAAERAETLALIQNFMWIDATNIPMVGFRRNTKNEYKKSGQELKITKDMFDPQYLYVTVKLNPASISDKQTEINNAINKVERLGMSREMAWDELGIENFELSNAQKTQEDLYQAMIQAKAKEIMMKPEMQAQQAQMQAQQQAQQQAQMQQNPGPGGPQSQFDMMQGMDTRGGGMAASMPMQGREQLTGQSASGQGIA